MLLAAASLRVRAEWDGSIRNAAQHAALLADRLAGPRRAVPPQPRHSAAPAQQSAAAATSDQALVQKYCVTCHNDRAKTGGLSLEGLEPGGAPPATPSVWEKVALKLRGGMMPPQGMPRPDEATLRGLRDLARAARSTRRR